MEELIKNCDIEIHNDKSRKFRTESIGFACSRRVLDIYVIMELENTYNLPIIKLLDD